MATETEHSELSSSPSGQVAPRRRRRVWALRASAIVLGLAMFGLLELVLAGIGLGAPDYHEDPFAGFSSVRPLFRLDEESGQYEIARSRWNFFRRDSFAAEKEPNTFRIFCLGGSTVQGRPFSIETSFPTFLEIALESADPTRKWEVVNCGGVSYASYRLVPIVEEVLDYAPDLIIVYSGHNEFLEDRTYAHIKSRPAAIAWIEETASRLRTFNLVRAALIRTAANREAEATPGLPELPTEVDVILNHKNGIAQYHRDEKWRRDVVEHYRHGLNSMAQMASDRGVPLMLVDPPANLRDCPPFKSEHRSGLSEEQLKRWNDAVASARRSYKIGMPAAIEHLKRAVAIDEEHAGLHFQLAQCYDAMAEHDMALAHYRRALELDVCPLRIIEPMNAAIREVADDWNLGVVDIRGLVRGKSRDGIPGADWFLDHVHPSIQGHQLIADALAEALVERGDVSPGEGWSAERERRYQAHVEALDDFYFVKGQQRLDTVRQWARGGVQ